VPEARKNIAQHFSAGDQSARANLLLFSYLFFFLIFSSEGTKEEEEKKEKICP